MEPQPDGKRRYKSLAQFAAEAEAMRANPWACPKCGCMGPHRVTNTYETKEGRKRRRICRNCGHRLNLTIEITTEQYDALKRDEE